MKKDQTLIQGVSRAIEKKLSYKTPMEILNLILSYYQLCLHVKNCGFESSKQILTVYAKYNIAYFTSMISWSRGRHVLEIKVLDNDCTNMGIGICSKYLEGYANDYFLEAEECGISYFAKLNRNSAPSFCHFENGAQKYRRYTSRQNYWNPEGEVIKVEYDLDSMQISFFMNGVLQTDEKQASNSAVYPIRKCKEYFFAFYCYTGYRFEIINCS